MKWDPIQMRLHRTMPGFPVVGYGLMDGSPATRLLGDHATGLDLGTRPLRVDASRLYFCRGYWDLAVNHRGVLFAPVFFSLGVMAPGFYFTPSYMIDLGVFSDFLFLRPRYHHYYFGDYYAPKYYRKGIYPWLSPHAKRHSYDPIYAHQRWKHRHDRNWENRLQATYQERRKHVEFRPPRRLYDAEKPGSNVNLPKAGARNLHHLFRR